MSRRLRVLSMLLAVVLLAGVLVAFAPGDEPEAKATLGPLQAVTLSAADFHPWSDNTDFLHDGYLISDGIHVARVPFPAEIVVITSVKARVHDNNASGNVCVGLYRAIPGSATEEYWGQDCTSDASSEDPQTLSVTAFNRIGRYHSAFLFAWFAERNAALRLYGATVFYRVVS